MATIKFDDTYGFVRPSQDGRTESTYPFLKNGDTAPVIYSRKLMQRAPYYVPLKPGTERDSVWPNGDPTAFNLPDSPIENTGISDLITFRRQYARIPGPQVTYPGSRYFTKPEYTPTAATNPFDIGAASEGVMTKWSDWSSLGNASYTSANGIFSDGDSKVYAPVKVPSAQVVGYASAGTFTLTYGASTTANLNYNDSTTTIATAINGLAAIISAGITATVAVSGLANSVSGGGLDITLAGGTDVARQVPITLDATGLTVSTSKNPTTSVVSANYQQIKLPTHLTVTGHGLTTSLDLAIVWATPSSFLLPVNYWGSIDANTLWVSPWGNNTYTAIYVGTYSYTYAGAAAVTYAAGIRLARTRVTERFYLPGVTAGITTAADITVSAGLQNPDDFLDALLTPLTGWQIYESSGPSFWMDGPIYRTETIEVNFDDLV